MSHESANKIFFNKVTIIGIGLIGASFALALKEKKLCGTVCGCGRSEDNLKQAKERGIIDAYSLDAKKACEGSDFILLATPVGAFKGLIETIKDTLKNGALLTDVGSVKGGLVYEIESAVRNRGIYVGSHPIAGSDKSGIEDARANLFRSARCIVTPTEKTDSAATEKIISVWKTFGAVVEIIDPYKHDEIYAAVSHLPHLVAYAIVNTVNDLDGEYIGLAGKGFKDATRIALSSPELWRDISMFNKDNLIKLIGLFKKNLEKMEKMLNSNDATGLEKEFSKAQALRKKLK